MSILMPLIMVTVVVGIALFALNKWNPAAATTTTTTTTTEEESTGKGACKDRKGEECEGGSSGCDGELNGETWESGDAKGKCKCKCNDGGGDDDDDGNGGGGKGEPGSQLKKLQGSVSPTKKPARTSTCKCLVPNCSCGRYARAYGAREIEGIHYIRTRGGYMDWAKPRRSYNTRAYNTLRMPRTPNINSRRLVEIPNDNYDNFDTTHARSYFMYEADQPDYNLTAAPTTTARARAYSAYNEGVGFDEQQNTMPFVRMYDTVRKVPIRFAGYGG